MASMACRVSNESGSCASITLINAGRDGGPIIIRARIAGNRSRSDMGCISSLSLFGSGFSTVNSEPSARAMPVAHHSSLPYHGLPTIGK